MISFLNQSTESPAPSPAPAAVGIAIDDMTLTATVERVLAGSGKYTGTVFTDQHLEDGHWPDGSWTAVVTTPRVLEIRRRQGHSPAADDQPVVCILSAEDFPRYRAVLAGAHSFLLDDKVARLLPSLIVLSAYRLSAMPAGEDTMGGVDPRLLPIQDLAPDGRKMESKQGGARANSVIAHILRLGETTAKAHIRRLIAALGLDNRGDAAVYAASLCLGDAPPQLTTFAGRTTKKQ